MIQKRDSKTTTSPENLRNRLFGQQESENRNPGGAPQASRQQASTAEPASAPGVASKAVATIGATMNVKGDLVGKEDVVLRGKLDGSVVLNDNDIDVDESGHLEGSVVAKHVLIKGEVNGEIQGLEKVTVASTGRVQGTISAPRVVLEDGGKFKGMIDMPLEKKTSGAQPPKSKEVNSPSPKRVAAAEAAATP